MKINFSTKSSLLIITSVSSILILLFSFQLDIFQYGDNCGYMTLGISFAEGNGFRDGALPHPVHFLWWPPGFPLFIALFYKLAGPQWHILKFIQFGMLSVSLFLYCLTLKSSKKNDFKPHCILCACSLSSGIHLLSSYLYSETFYIICTLLFFYLCQRWFTKINLLKIIALSLFAVYIGSVRLIGISISVAFIIYLALYSDKNTAVKYYSFIPAVIFGVFIGTALFYPPLKVDSFRATIGLIPQFSSEILGNVEHNNVTFSYLILHLFNKAVTFIQGYGMTLIPQALIRSLYDLYEMNRIKAIIMGTLSCTVLVGWTVTRKENPLVALYVFLYMTILFFHGPLYVRLLIPIIPFLIVYFYNGVEAVTYWLTKSKLITSSVITIVWIIVVVDNAYLSFTDPHRTMYPKFGDNDYQNCILWINKNTKPRDIVVSQVHSYLYLLRGPYCLPYFGAYSANEVISYVDTYKATYLIVSPFYQRPHYSFMKYVTKAVNLYPERFSIAFQNKNSTSYVLAYRSPYSHR